MEHGNDTILADTIDNNDRLIKRTIKDAVFTSVFRDRSNVAVLYRDLHPDQSDVDENDVEIVTLEKVVSPGRINDLGFVVRNRILCLVEAQTVRMRSIMIRNLLYLSDTYQRIMRERDLTVYDVSEGEIPIWEIYVIYPREKGKDGGVKVQLHDSIPKNLFDLSGGRDIQVGSDGVISDYANVCERIDRIITEEGNGKDALRELIEECRGKDGVIEKFIVSREAEIMDMFEEMWTWEGSVRAYARYLRKVSIAEGKAEGMAEGRAVGMAEGRAVGMAEGRAEGKAEEDAKIIRNMLDKGYTPKQIEEITGISFSENQQI